MVPPRSDRIARVPPYSRIIARITRTGLSPAMVRLSRLFRLSRDYHWPGPRSLATTCGVSVDVLSSGYLDVSVPRVRFLNPMYSGKRYLVNPIVDRPKATTIKFQVGFPIRKSMDQSLFSAPHGLSQSITSFIASYCQGIHQTPFSRLI